MDFEIQRCESLPDLLDKDNFNGPPPGQRGGYQNGGPGRGRPGGSRGWGGDRGGGQSSSRRGNQDASVFVGNLSYTASQEDIRRMFSGAGLNSVDVRLLHDDQGKSKGSAFVEFGTVDEAQRACALGGQRLGGAQRPLRINPAKRG